MAAAFLLQDWTTIRGATQTTVVTQPMSRAVDLFEYDDLVLFVEVADYTNVTLATQTSPTNDDVLFQSMAPPVVVAAIGVTTCVFRYAVATLPLARYVRWQATGSAAGAWSLTFRIWLSPNRSAQASRPANLMARLQAIHDERLRASPTSTDAPADWAESSQPSDPRFPGQHT